MVFDAGSLSGVFDNASNGQRVTTLGGGASLMVHDGASSTFDPTQIVLSGFLVVPLPGDFNNNLLVDAADYVVWRKNQGTTNTLPNDPTGGTIGPAQHATWRTHFGQSAGNGSIISANALVPEPAAWALLVFAAAGGFPRRRRTHRKSQLLIDG